MSPTIALACLIAMDAVLTVLGTYKGLREANPVQRYLQQRYGLVAVLVTHSALIAASLLVPLSDVQAATMAGFYLHALLANIRALRSHDDRF